MAGMADDYHRRDRVEPVGRPGADLDGARARPAPGRTGPARRCAARAAAAPVPPVPRLGQADTPAAALTGSSLLARPAPSRHAAVADRERVQAAASQPAAGADDLCAAATAAPRPGRRPVRRSSRGSVASARPSASAAAGSASMPASASISLASASVDLDQVGRPCPRRAATDSSTSTALPTARPSGTSIPVSSAAVRTPTRSPSATMVCASSPGRVQVAHERAAADLDVQHQRPGALGDLLGHDRAGDQRDRLHRPGDVAQRVQLAVGRGQALPGRADDAADRRAAWRATRRPAGRPASRGWTPACPGCRRCGRARGRTAAARPRRSAATSGARISETLSPTPPVECLSTVGAGTAAQVKPLAGADHRVGPGPQLGVAEPAEEDRHEHGRHLLVGDLALGIGADQPADVVAGERQAVALGADQVDAAYGHGAGVESSPSRARGQVGRVNGVGQQVAELAWARRRRRPAGPGRPPRAAAGGSGRTGRAARRPRRPR